MQTHAIRALSIQPHDTQPHDTHISSGPFASYLYGDCTFTFTGNGVLELADEIVAAGKHAAENV